MQLADLEGRERTAEHKSLQKSNFPLLPCFPPLDLSYRGAVFRGKKLLSDFKACARLKKRKVWMFPAEAQEPVRMSKCPFQLPLGEVPPNVNCCLSSTQQYKNCPKFFTSSPSATSIRQGVEKTEFSASRLKGNFRTAKLDNVLVCGFRFIRCQARIGGQTGDGGLGL
ncbi:hypothetical protein RRG08_046420 [Elysia crispata]|uniref:Uncharacterized protein n=1 Tax=Elysia crispata TaxID=231223 RepID=A0AAE0Z8R0_9GAST|nr:hypothetical protein RRG08_046420 [Elysia crispata]